jgi:hypothetical protein
MTTTRLNEKAVIEGGDATVRWCRARRGGQALQSRWNRIVHGDNGLDWLSVAGTPLDTRGASASAGTRAPGSTGTAVAGPACACSWPGCPI